MEGEDSLNGQAKAPEEHRRQPRYTVDGDLVLQFVDLGISRACRIVDLSLNGCRVVTGERLAVNAGRRVELVFKVEGITFRFNGVLRWTDGRSEAGIQFVDVIPRHRAHLTKLIEEIEVVPTPKASEEPPQKTSPQPGPPRQTPPDPELAPAVAEQGTAAASQSAKAERRVQVRYRLDASASIVFVRAGSMLSGQIVDLSLGGCCIRIPERYPIDIYTRIETEFRLRGQPFRLGGVIQSIHNSTTIGVRFLDMSDRKRQQVEELMEEIQEARTTHAGGDG